MGAEGLPPLPCVLLVFPASLVSGDVACRTLGEGQADGPASRIACLDRINTIGDKLALRQGAFTRFGQSEVRGAAEPHIARAPVEHVAKYPTLAARLPDV